MVGTEVFLRFDTTNELNLQSGAPGDGNLFLSIELPRNRTLAVDFRGRKALLKTADSASTIPWSDIAFVSLPTYAASEFEMRLDLSELGVVAGDPLKVSFEGSDELAEAIELTANDTAATYADLPSTDRVEGAIRVASINTLRSGLADPQRAPIFRGLLEFASADVYCFNEEWDEAKFLSSVPAVIDRPSLNLVWSNGCGLASEYPLETLDLGLARGASALLEVPGHEPLVVISVHFKCCGFAGSDEDKQRIEEAEQLAGVISDIRDGNHGEKAATAGIVILGDYNLVGSRKPLDIIKAQGFDEFLLKSPVDGSAATWRGISPRESFWPGRLDYVTFDSSKLRAVGGYSMNTDVLGKLKPKLSD